MRYPVDVMSNSRMYIYVHTLSSHKKVLGNGTDVGLGPRILLDIERLSNAVIMSSLLDEISVGLTSPIKIYTVKTRLWNKTYVIPITTGNESIAEGSA